MRRIPFFNSLLWYKYQKCGIRSSTRKQKRLVAGFLWSPGELHQKPKLQQVKRCACGALVRLHSSKKQAYTSSLTVGLVFASTCCLSAPRHGCYFLAFGLVDCLRQEGQKPKPQPEFVRACWPLPVPYSRTRSTLNAQAVRAASRSPSRVPFPWQAGCGSRRRPASASDYISSIS